MGSVVWAKLRRIAVLAVVSIVSVVSGGWTVAAAQERIKLADDRQIKSQTAIELRFDLKAIPRGKQVRLCMDARIEWGGLGGSTGAMVVHVNEKGLLGRHLVNKPLLFSMRNDEEITWGTETDCGYRLAYSPDFSDRLRTDEAYEYGIPDTDPYRFVWDVTSYVRAGGNSLTIAVMPGMSFSLRVRDVAVEIGDPLPAVAATAAQNRLRAEPAPTGPLPTYAPRGPAEMPASVEVSSRGGIRFRVGRREFRVRSRTSLPQGRWSEEGKGQASWSRLVRGGTSTARWTEADYSVERRVTLHSDRVAVADTIRNTSAALVGVIAESRLELPEKPQRTLLAGHAVKRLRQRSSPSHPTALAEFGDLAVGMVAEDDIFRIHCKAFVEDGALALSDPQLGIAAGEAHTLEWSLYAVPGGDYWDFVNAVRRNWGSNATLRGPSMWIHPAGAPGKAEAVKPWLQGASLVVLCNPMLGTEEERAQKITVQHGTALPLCRDWCELARRAVRVAKEADPSVEVFVYTHHNLCTEPGHAQKYRDSRALDPAGKSATTVYTPPPSLFVPTLDDSYGKALMAVQKDIVDRLDANLYIDEITASNVPAFGAYSNAWDGCTVVIDPVSHAITGRLTSAVLLMQPWRAALVRHVKSRGKTVLANGPHYTRTMMGWGLQCFVESTPEDNSAVAAHLSHPLCLAHYGGPFSTERYQAAQRLLDRAGILFVGFSADVSALPITPIELRAGVVIGRERILTNRSGRFGWGDDSDAAPYVFDGQGKRVPNPDVKKVRQGGKVFTELRMPGDHLAVLVRRNG